MMNKLKLIVCFFIATNYIINGQVKQNDATWEETISFIKKKSFHIIADGCYTSGTIISSEHFSDLKIFDDTISYIWAKGSGNDECIYKIDLSKLKSTKVSEAGCVDGIYLRFTGSYVVRNYVDGSSPDEKSSYQQFFMDDNEIADRILKAFIHLAYLATKKREEKRKASGDKF